MTQDADNVRLFEGCAVYFAPVGTTGPTDLTTAPAAAWLDGGLVVSDDGGQQEVDIEAKTFTARGTAGVFPVRKSKQVNSRKIVVVFAEDNKNLDALLSPATTRVTTTGVTTITHKMKSGTNDWALLLERWDGSLVHSRYIVAKADATETALPRLYGSEPTRRAVEFEIYIQADGTYATEITNDPALAAAP